MDKVSKVFIVEGTHPSVDWMKFLAVCATRELAEAVAEYYSDVYTERYISEERIIQNEDDLRYV